MENEFSMSKEESLRKLIPERLKYWMTEASREDWFQMMSAGGMSKEEFDNLWPIEFGDAPNLSGSKDKVGFYGQR